MKTIFVCTDFSACSENALKYAVYLAQETGAKIILFHGFLITSLSSSYFPDVSSADELSSLLEQDLLQKMQQSIKEYQDVKYHDTDNGHIEFSFLIHNGLPEDDIAKLAKQENADLILMGTKGKNALERVLLGSVTHATIQQKLPCPVLAIPNTVTYQTPEHLVFASQFSDLEFDTIDHLIQQWAIPFDAKITCLHIDSPTEENPNVTQFKEKYFLTPLSRMDYERFTSENITVAIDDFLARKNAHIIALLKYRQDFFERLFHHSQTNEMLRQKNLPILVYTADPTNAE